MDNNMGRRYSLSAEPWNGADEQRYVVTETMNPDGKSLILTEAELRQMIAMKELPAEIGIDLDEKKWSLEQTDDGEQGCVNRRSRDIAEYQLDWIEPKERYRLTNASDMEKEVIVPYGTGRQEILRQERRFLRKEPAKGLHWIGWKDLDVATLSQSDRIKLQKKLEKKQYDIDYQREKVDRIYLSVPRGYKAKLEDAAKKAGTYKTQFLRSSIEAEIAVQEGREVRLSVSDELRDAYEHRVDKERSLSEFVGALLKEALRSQIQR